LIGNVRSSRRYQVPSEGLQTITALVVLRDTGIKSTLAGTAKPKPSRKPNSWSAIDQHYGTMGKVLMSESLQQRLRTHLDSKHLIAVLSQTKSLEFVRFLPELEGFDTEKVYRDVIYGDAQPDSSLSIASGEAATSAWLRSLLGQTNIKHSCYLKIADAGRAPWAEVRVADSGEWLISLWTHLTMHALLIVDHSIESVLIIEDEEYSYEAYLRRFIQHPAV